MAISRPPIVLFVVVALAAGVALIAGGLGGGWWMIVHGLAGPWAGVAIYHATPGVFEYVATAAFLAVWALYALLPSRLMMVFVVFVAVAWCVLGWAIGI